MFDDVAGYPLQWPIGWERTPEYERRAARFDTTLAAARDGLMNELRLMGARNVVISTDIPLRKDGLPYAKYSTPRDTGVAVYFDLNGEQKCFPCDRWNRIEDNIQAVRKTIEALRGIERWGSKSMINATFMGFNALPEKANAGWWTVLGVERDARSDDVWKAYRAAIFANHPDQGGDADQFHRTQEAYADFKRERGTG